MIFLSFFSFFLLFLFLHLLLLLFLPVYVLYWKDNEVAESAVHRVRQSVHLFQSAAAAIDNSSPAVSPMVKAVPAGADLLTGCWRERERERERERLVTPIAV
jgi:hypothetical protein